MLHVRLQRNSLCLQFEQRIIITPNSTWNYKREKDNTFCRIRPSVSETSIIMVDAELWFIKGRFRRSSFSYLNISSVMHYHGICALWEIWKGEMMYIEQVSPYLLCCNQLSKKEENSGSEVDCVYICKWFAYKNQMFILETYMCFSMHLKCNSIHIYQSEKYFKEKL